MKFGAKKKKNELGLNQRHLLEVCESVGVSVCRDAALHLFIISRQCCVSPPLDRLDVTKNRPKHNTKNSLHVANAALEARWIPAPEPTRLPEFTARNNLNT